MLTSEAMISVGKTSVENLQPAEVITRYGILNLFPNEVLEKLLSHLSPQKLLECRMVNRRWKAVASFLCRKRNVKLIDFNGSNAIIFFKTFENNHVQDIPWSSCILHCRSSDVPINHNFLTFYGPFLLQLYCTDYIDGKVLLNILEQTPNLQVLEIYSPDDEDEDCERVVNLYTVNIKLPQLKYLVISGFAVLALLKYISRICNPCVVTLHVRKSFATITEKSVNEFVSLLVPFYKISFWIENLQEGLNFLPFAEHGLKITKLWINFTEPQQHDPYNFYQILESFLGNCKILNELFLCCNYRDEKLKTGGAPLKLPHLPILKTLSLDHIRTGSGSYEFLNPFELDQFPMLEKLILENFHEWGTDESILKFSEFQNVTELHLGEYIPKNLSLVFPNLMKLYSQPYRIPIEYLCSPYRIFSVNFTTKLMLIQLNLPLPISD